MAVSSRWCRSEVWHTVVQQLKIVEWGRLIKGYRALLSAVVIVPKSAYRVLVQRAIDLAGDRSGCRSTSLICTVVHWGS